MIPSSGEVKLGSIIGNDIPSYVVQRAYPPGVVGSRVDHDLSTDPMVVISTSKALALGDTSSPYTATRVKGWQGL